MLCLCPQDKTCQLVGLKHWVAGDGTAPSRHVKIRYAAGGSKRVCDF